MNKYDKHIYVIPEDRDDEKLAIGFVSHHDVNQGQIKVMPVAGGWPNVLKTFQDEYIKALKNNSFAHVVMIIDFDGQFDERRPRFEVAIPEELKSRVFVIGPKIEPVDLKRGIGKHLEEIGCCLAADCHANTTTYWDNEHLNHNDADRRRLVEVIRPFLFRSTR